MVPHVFWTYSGLGQDPMQHPQGALYMQWIPSVHRVTREYGQSAVVGFMYRKGSCNGVKDLKKQRKRIIWGPNTKLMVECSEDSPPHSGRNYTARPACCCPKAELGKLMPQPGTEVA